MGNVHVCVWVCVSVNMVVRRGGLAAQVRVMLRRRSRKDELDQKG